MFPHIYIYTHMHLYPQIYIHAYIYIFIHMYVHVGVYVYIYIYVNICIREASRTPLPANLSNLKAPHSRSRCGPSGRAASIARIPGISHGRCNGSRFSVGVGRFLEGFDLETRETSEEATLHGNVEHPGWRKGPSPPKKNGASTESVVA